MTTNHHTPIATGAAANAATWNTVFEQLDAAITAGLGGITLTNKSGGALSTNDCVIVDTANNEAVTTTTSAGSILRPGIILVGGAVNSQVTVSLIGEVAVVVDGAATRGQYFKTSTTAKRVTPVSTLDVGVFGIFTANSSGGAGTTAVGLLFGFVVTAPGTHTHAAADIISGLLALARGGSGADLSAAGPGYVKQASLGAALTVAAILAADLPAATDSAQGAVELATSAETAAGTDTTRPITPATAAAAYFLRSLFINTSAGAGDAGKPMVLDASGKIAASMIAPSTIDHNQLLNLAAADPHTQYILKNLLATKGDLIVRDASGPQRLAAGAASQVLAVDAAEPTGLKWVPQVSGGSGIPGSTIDARGDLIVGTADETYSRLAVGANGQALVADSGQATGLMWSYLPQDNIFFNCGFDVWQRSADDTGVTTTRKYGVDRWAVKTGAGTLAHVQRSTTLRTGALSKYSMQLDGAAGVTTVDIDQRIEAAMSGRYKRQVYFTAYIYNGSGAAFTPKLFVSTPAAADNWSSSTVRNGGGSGEDLQSCADSAWTQVIWTADISSYPDIGYGVEFRLQIPSGSLVAGDIVRLAEMNLVPGSATPFVGRLITLELAACQRYFWRTPPGGTETWPVITAYAGGGSQYYYVTLLHPIPMRTTPTLAKNGTWAVSNCSQPTAVYASIAGFTLEVISTAGGYMAANPNSSDDYIDVDAEL